MQVVTRIIFVLALIGLSFPASPAQAGDPPCTTRAGNLTRNGSVTDGGYSTQYGTVINEWNPFIYGGSAPTYALADNESANGDLGGSSSQYIHGDGVEFDAGIYQTVTGTQPGAWYEFSVGWAAMLRDTGGGQNKKMDGVIARRVGVDPTGSTDSRSPNVVWGPELWTGSSGQSLNSSNMKLLFAAQSDHVTAFVRAYNRGAAASDKVFFDVICLLLRSDLPTTTPLATATNTPAPTNTLGPTIVIAPAMPAATRESTDTPTTLPTNTPTLTNTPLPTSMPTETPKPRRPIPEVAITTNVSGASINSSESNLQSHDTNVKRNNSNLVPMAVLFGSVGLVGFSLIGIFALGLFLAWRMHRPPRALYDSAFSLDEQTLDNHY